MTEILILFCVVGALRAGAVIYTGVQLYKKK